MGVSDIDWETLTLYRPWHCSPGVGEESANQEKPTGIKTRTHTETEG